MKCKAIILDLDNTIFATRSMDSAIFEPFFTDLRARLSSFFDDHIINMIHDELWEKPFDVVIKKFNIPEKVFLASWAVLDKDDFDLDISTYGDYGFLRSVAIPMFLVTTGPEALQAAKVEALGIKGDFIKIVINDKFREKKTKADIFLELVHEFSLSPQDTFVIGDNPDSKIEAGNSLDMVTVQILRADVLKGNNAKHYINTFDELKDIIN
jgi:FMN phosphatase YigB (HAD superfamily)